MPSGEHLKGKGGPKKFGSEGGPNKMLGGRKPKPKFIDIIEEIAEKEGKVTFDKFNIVTGEDGIKRVEVEVPTDLALAMILMKNSAKDHRWFSEMAKIRGLYSAKEIDVTVKDKTDMSIFSEEMINELIAVYEKYGIEF